MASSRGWTAGFDEYGFVSLTVNGDEDPIISFNPKDFLAEYFDHHPVGKESTNLWYQGKDYGDGFVKDEQGDDIYLYYGETGLGYTDPDYDPDDESTILEGLEYMIFPVWWRTNRYGDKNYQLQLIDYFEADSKYGEIMPFNDAQNGRIPFPYLGYSETEVASENVLANINSFTYDNGDFTQAYDPSTVGTVVSKGLKVTTVGDELDVTALRMDLWCGTGDKESFSSTVPYWNRKHWGAGKYYDVTISNLMFSTVSTMMHTLTPRNFNILNYPGDNGTNPTYSRRCEFPMLVGFTSSPEGEADLHYRDYTDLILLVLPMNDLELFYNLAKPVEPYVWTMAVEDLGGTDDWDFNDIVFHFTDVVKSLNSINGNKIVTKASGPMASVSVRAIDVWPVASGGTMPVYITFTGTVSKMEPMPTWGDMMFSEANNAIKEAAKKVETGTFVIGTEVHKWLGASHYTQFVNVGNSRNGASGKVVQFRIPADADLKYVEKGAHGSEQNKPLYGFSILVDKENTLQIDAFNEAEHGMKTIDNLKLGEGTYMIGAPDENGSIAPQMLLISDGDGSWEWPTERTKISDAYPDFNHWITNIR
ncbi:MAG: LruC domain-containing protein, partial [Muribaculaceae bacterium]|nr:LruC domain-containing protein [Muribaculaceae bacterium]